MSDEFEKPISQFRHDMLQAFRHGIEYEHVGHENDIVVEETKDKHLPFAEWFVRHYQERDTPAPEQADADGVGEAHTKGSWKALPTHYAGTKPYIEAESGSRLASIHLRHPDRATDEDFANARLMARAPDLLAENATLRADLATVTAKRNEAFNVGTALEADLKAERKYADTLAENMGGLRFYIDPNMPDADDVHRELVAWVAAHDARRTDRDGGEA